MMSALVLIIAKIVAIVEASLDSFVTITAIPANCDANMPVTVLTGTLSCDGLALAGFIEDSILSIAGLVPNLLQGLGVVV